VSAPSSSWAMLPDMGIRLGHRSRCGLHAPESTISCISNTAVTCSSARTRGIGADCPPGCAAASLP
jgi:hypothetical protein